MLLTILLAIPTCFGIECVVMFVIAGICVVFMSIFGGNDLQCLIIRSVAFFIPMVMLVLAVTSFNGRTEEYKAIIEKINCENTENSDEYSIVFHDANGEIHSADVEDAYALLLQEGDAVTILIENCKTPLTRSTYCMYSVKSNSAETSTLAKIFSFD